MTISPFETEAFTYYGIAVLVVGLRVFARAKILGWNPKNWHGDDFFVLLFIIFFSCACTCLHLIGLTGTNSNLTDDKTADMDQETINGIARGSLADFCGWVSYTTAVWCLKVCLLHMYARMTLGLQDQQRMLTYIAVFVLLGYVALQCTILFHCVPVQKQWQVRPYPGDKCTLGIPNVIMLGITNISTDILLLLIPIPILWKVRLPLKKKLLLALLLCSGVFVILATTLRVIFTLRSIRVKNESAIWAIRETFVATITVNAPLIKPLISSSSWFKSISSSSNNNRNNTPQYPLSDFKRSQNKEGNGNVVPARESFTMVGGTPRRYSYDNGSDEETACRPKGGLTINMTTTCEVESMVDLLEAREPVHDDGMKRSDSVRKEEWDGSVARPIPAAIPAVGNIVRIEGRP